MCWHSPILLYLTKKLKVKYGKVGILRVCLEKADSKDWLLSGYLVVKCKRKKFFYSNICLIKPDLKKFDLFYLKPKINCHS